MSETKKRNPEKAAVEAVQDSVLLEQTSAESPSVQDQGVKNMQKNLDDRENAPRGTKANSVEKKKSSSKKSKKKHRKSGMALPLVAVLVAVALVFGVVVGYAVGRNASGSRLEKAEARLKQLEAEEEAFQGESMNVFEEELTGENQAALNELSGQNTSLDEQASALMGEDALDGSGNAADGTQSVVVAEFEGGQLMSDEVSRAYEEQMTSYLFAGYSEEEISASLLDEVMHSMVSDRVLEAHAREMGLYDLTDEDMTQIEAEAEARYQEQIDYYRDMVDTEGMTPEEANGAVKAYLQEVEGVTLEGLRAEIEKDWWMDKIFDAITADISVSDEELQEAYDALLEEQTNNYQTYPEDFEFAQMNGETIVFNLPGYRAVRMLLLRMSLEESDNAYALASQIQQLDPETQAEEIQQLQAQLDGCYADAQQQAEDILAQLESGADFVELMKTVGEDDGMKDPKLENTGYYISESSQLWPQSIIDASMAMNEEGQISEPLRTEEGICILQYVGEVPQGEVPLEDVREYLLQDTLESAKQEAYQQQLDAWVQEANPQYYPERMQ